MYEKIKELRLEARKSSNKLELLLLTCIQSDCEAIIGRKGKIADDQVIRIVEKLIKASKENQKHRDDPVYQQEIDYLEKFVPNYLTYDEVCDKLKGSSIQSQDNLGLAIKFAMDQMSGETFQKQHVVDYVKSIF